MLAIADPPRVRPSQRGGILQAWLRDVVFERFQAVVGAVLGACLGAAAVLGFAPASGWVAAAWIAAGSASQALAFPLIARFTAATGSSGFAARLYRDLVFVAGAAAAACGGVWLLRTAALEVAGGASDGATALAFGSGLATGALLLAGHAVWPQRIRVSRHRIALRGLAHDATPLRLAHLSDLHLGNGLTVRRLERLVRQTNAVAPDLVVLTGDLFDGPGELLEPGARALASLRAPLGVFAVLGNHDVELGAERVASVLQTHAPAFRLLRGDGQRLPTAADPAPWIGGLDDPGRDWTRDGGLPALEALARLRPHDAPAILLVHRPDAFPQAARLGFDLVLSGHFHGGQIALPRRIGGLSPASALTRFARGRYQRDGATLFVSRGIGFAGPRVRLGSPPELALLELVPPDGEALAVADDEERS